MISDKALEMLFDETIYFIEDVEYKVTVVHDQKHNFDSSEEKALLWNILNAVQISQKETKIIEGSKHSIISENKTPFYILFGITPHEIGFTSISGSQYEVFEFEKTKIVSAHPLKTIKNNNDKKKALWLSLKKMFSV